MIYLKSIVYQLVCASLVLCCNIPTQTQNRQQPFYKQFEGQIGNHAAVLNLVKTGQLSQSLFLGYFYYKDSSVPTFLQGSHIFYPTDKFVSSIEVNSYQVEKSMIDTLRYSSDQVKLYAGYDNFTGSFESDTIFVGVFTNKNGEKLPFRLKEKLDRDSSFFDISFIKKDTFLDVGINKNVHVKLSVDLVKPINNSETNLSLQKNIFEVLTNCEGIYQNKSTIDSCLSSHYSVRFSEYKIWKANFFQFESVVLPIYNEKSLFSFACLDSYFTDRKEGYRISVRTYNKTTKQIIKFNDVFKIGSKDKIASLVRKWTNLNNISSFNFDENNFYMTDKSVVFVLTGLEENRYKIDGKEFVYSFGQIKDLVKPNFWNILK